MTTKKEIPCPKELYKWLHQHDKKVKVEMTAKKIICQECGKVLSSWSEKHTLLDCGEYHLKRAKEILWGKLNDKDRARV